VRHVAIPAALLLVGLTGCGSSNNAATPGSSFCNSAQSLTQFLSLAGSPSGTDLQTIKNQLQTLTAAIDQMDSNAPSDIASDMHSLRQAIDQSNTKAQSASNTDQIGSAFGSQSSSSALNDAGNRVTAYVQQHCGINLNGSQSSSSSSSSSSAAGGAGTDTSSSST